MGAKASPLVALNARCRDHPIGGLAAGLSRELSERPPKGASALPSCTPGNRQTASGLLWQLRRMSGVIASTPESGRSPSTHCGPKLVPTIAEARVIHPHSRDSLVGMVKAPAMHVVARTWLSDDMRHDDQTPLIDDGSPGDRRSGQLEWDQNKGSFLSTVSAIQVPRHMARNPTLRSTNMFSSTVAGRNTKAMRIVGVW
jgi:hypothetical protein